MSRERLQVRHFYHKAEHRTTRFLEVFSLGRGEHEVTLRDVFHYNCTEKSIFCWKFGTELLALMKADRVAAQLIEAGYVEMR
jgi:hypothetical protein